MIREKALAGKSAYQIGKELGISKNTASKYMDLSMPEKPTYSRPSKLDPFKQQIDEMMSSGIFNCEVILRELRSCGYDGGISILKDYVHPFRPAKTAPAVRRYETPSGRQAQMDWGICQYSDRQGNVHKVPAFVMILGCSRAKYVEFASRCDLASLLRCMVNAFVYYGGIPQQILTDNMKTVVNGREAGQILWNPGFEGFAADMGFVPKVCRVRRPQTKGKVERLVRYVKENFFPGRIFSSIDDLNRQVLQWCREADLRPNGTTGKIPLAELRNEELYPLPSRDVLDRYRWEDRLVSREGFVSYDGILYGVPWQYSGKKVRVRLLNGRLDIRYDNVSIAEHEAVHGGSNIVWLPGQYRGLTERGGYAGPRPVGHLAGPVVEVRDLNIYERAAGGAL